MMNRILITSMLSILLCACDVLEGREILPGEIGYCVIGETLLDGRSRFNLKDKLLIGAHTTFLLEIHENQVARGFIYPFPLGLPKLSAEEFAKRTEPLIWEFGDYRFVASMTNPQEPDWVLIHAYLIGPPEKFGNAQIERESSVLYSFKRGVLSYRDKSTSVQDNFSLISEMRACSGKGFFVDDLK